MTTTTKPATVCASDILLFLAPPVRLVDWLERAFEAKRKQGEEIPEAYTAWLARWDEIRTGLPSKIDLVTPEEWKRLAELVF